MVGCSLRMLLSIFLSFIAPLLFSVTIILNISYYFITISEERKKGKTFDQIEEGLNRKAYLSVRGKKFRGAHVHSIVKKKRLRDKKFEKEYLEVRSDFHLDIFDRTLINMVKSED